MIEYFLLSGDKVSQKNSNSSQNEVNKIKRLGSSHFNSSPRKQIEQANGNQKQIANCIENEESLSDALSIQGNSHSSPFLANNNENQLATKAATTPNSITGQRDLPNPPVNTGTTMEAKNTSEKLAQSDDNALNSDCESLIAHNDSKNSEDQSIILEWTRAKRHLIRVTR